MDFNPGGALLLVVGAIAVIVGFRGTQKNVAAILTGGRTNTPSATLAVASTTDASAASVANPPTGTAGYLNPLRDVKGLVSERVDQGVDYGGTGALHALGPGTIQNVRSAGWPGGTFIQELLTGGPAAGQSVYYAEDINPLVTVGQSVDANTVIGDLTGGSSGIEIGWANPNASAQQALGASQWHESAGDTTSTAYGVNFNQLLGSLGAPMGQQHGEQGQIPNSWPSWGVPAGLL